MTPAEVIARMNGGRLHAHVVGEWLRIRWSYGPVIVDLPIRHGLVDAGYVCILLSDID